MEFGSDPDCSSGSLIGLGAGPYFGTGPSTPSNPSLSRLSSASALLHVASTSATVVGSELSSYLDSDTIKKFDDDFNILVSNRDVMGPVEASVGLVQDKRL